MVADDRVELRPDRGEGLDDDLLEDGEVLRSGLEHEIADTNNEGRLRRNDVFDKSLYRLLEVVGSRDPSEALLPLGRSLLLLRGRHPVPAAGCDQQQHEHEAPTLKLC